MTRDEMKSYVQTHYHRLTAEKIGSEIGISRNAVIGIANRMGLAKPNPGRKGVPKRPPEEIAELRAEARAVRGYMTTADAGRVLGISPGYVSTLSRTRDDGTMVRARRVALPPPPPTHIRHMAEATREEARIYRTDIVRCACGAAGQPVHCWRHRLLLEAV